MSLAPTLSVTLGNLRYDTHAVELHACLEPLPRGNSVRVSLPATVRFEAAPADDAAMDVDGGEGLKKLFTGKVRTVRRDFRRIHVTLADAATDLAAYRPCQTFEKQNAKQVIRTLASDAGVNIGDIDVDLDLPAYVAQPGRTAAEQVAELARLSGAIALIDAEGKLNVIARPSGQPSIALLYGREMIDYSSSDNETINAQRFAIGFGPAGSASAPDALRPSLDFVPSSAAAGGAGIVRYPLPLLRTPTAADDVSTALQTSNAARAKRLRSRCFLLPALRPGDVIEVQSLPDGLGAGPWLLTRVQHELRPGSGGFTTIEAESADTSSLLSGLLGAGLSAIGGLL
ncbi:MAG TPA: hypothetical protein VFR51_04385 [Pyrinomonadaceae bacterium]|nr:hypothetical protein [Pyrinomonadaceae bacterium]